MHKVLQFGMQRLLVVVSGIERIDPRQQRYARLISTFNLGNHDSPKRRSFRKKPKNDREGCGPMGPGSGEELQKIVVIQVDGKHVVLERVADQSAPYNFLTAESVSRYRHPLLERLGSDCTVEWPLQREIRLHTNRALFSLQLYDVGWVGLWHFS
jgi:hypothetical protein